MIRSAQSSAEPDPPPPPGQFAIGPYRRKRKAEEHGLVILSMRLSYELVRGPAGFYLWVDEDQAEAIYEQLAKYQKENRLWPPRPLAAHPEDQPPAPLSLVGYAVVLIAFFAAQKHWGYKFQSLGVMDNRKLFRDGDWALPFTALTLHADIGHLTANVVSGVCFGILMNRVIPAGLAWTLFVLAGGLGNTLTAWFYWPEIHRNLGASTAIFGALGILAGHATASRFSPAETMELRHRLIPLAAGIVILLLTGWGTGNVDVMAHGFGFVAGVPLGALGFWLHRRWPRPTESRWLLAVPLAITFAAWWSVWR